MASKEEIIEEIKRMAAKNSGVPLGVSRFEQETGIKPYEWERYWARFGDAQKEAGFSPNLMQGAHAADLLVEKLALLSLKLGKFPTSRELEIEHHRDPEFPTKKAFQRIGNKNQLAQLVIDHCADRADLTGVISFCQAVLDSQPTSDDASDVDVDIGEVYLFKSGRFFKIGRTNDTVRRGSEIRIQLPEKTTLIHSIKTDDPSGVESYWHRRFDKKRMNGEWFNLSPADVKAFKRWRKIS